MKELRGLDILIFGRNSEIMTDKCSDFLFVSCTLIISEKESIDIQWTKLLSEIPPKWKQLFLFWVNLFISVGKQCSMIVRLPNTPKLKKMQLIDFISLQCLHVMH